MNLVRAELGRLTARGFVRLMLAVLIGAFAVTIATTIAGSHRPTAVELADAQQQAREQRVALQQSYEQCLAARDRADPNLDERFRPDCTGMDPSQITAEDFLYGVFVYEIQIRPLSYFLVAFLTLFGFLVGASFIGADLTSGGMTNLLLWRPQRMTVLATKLGTLLAAVLGIAVVAAALYLGAFWVIAQVGGLTGQVDAEFWRGLTLTTGRGLGLTLGATATGFAIATLGRHTAAALGVAAAYAVVWEIGVRIVMEIVDAARPGQWMLSSYLVAWMQGELELWDGGCAEVAPGTACNPSYTLTWAHGLVVLLLVGGGCVAAAFAVFRRRDLA